MTNILDLFHMSWRSLLEVGILTVGIYYVFNFVRGTRGAPVVYGFVVLLLSFSILTAVFKFKVLSWIFSYFLVYLLVAVLVIFQPELRRLLAELGNKPFFQTTREQRENIEVITQSAERLAEAR